MQSLEALRAWAAAHPEQVAALAYAALNLLVALVPLRYHAHPLFGLALRALTRLAALTPPDAPGTLKAPGAGVEAPQAKPDAPTKREGFVRLDVVCFVGGMLGGLAFLASVTGCPPWERPACGSPRAYQCVNDQPHVCSPSQRLTPIGDQPCAAIGGVCALDDAGVAHCMAGGAP